jgi:beta-lactamase class A
VRPIAEHFADAGCRGWLCVRDIDGPGSEELFEVIRNEAGVIEYPDGGRYAAAVFTRATKAWVGENEINATIGRTAAEAVRRIRTR